jgi:hypothetical protein
VRSSGYRTGKLLKSFHEKADPFQEFFAFSLIVSIFFRSAKPSLSPSFHPHSCLCDFRSVPVGCSRFTVALKMAASDLRTSQSYLGAQFRRLRARLDTPVAIKAMAAKLARLIYRMLRYGSKYLDQGALFYETQQRARQIRALKRKAAEHGFQLVQAPRPKPRARGVSGELIRWRFALSYAGPESVASRAR